MMHDALRDYGAGVPAEENKKHVLVSVEDKIAAWFSVQLLLLFCKTKTTVVADPFSHRLML